MRMTLNLSANLYFRFALSLGVLSLGVGCSSVSKTTPLVSDQDLVLEKMDPSGALIRQDIKKGEVFEIGAEVGRLSGSGLVPLLVVGADVANSDPSHTPWKVSLSEVKTWRPKDTDLFLTQELDLLYTDLLQIMELARERNIETASEKINRIIDKYPKLASAYYVRAQLEIMAGKKQTSIRTLEAALALRPEFKEALTLKRQISNSKEIE
jgi:tetratricopeptide (TPR) repeat protein